MIFENIYKNILYIIYNTYESETVKIYEKVNENFKMTYATFKEHLKILVKQKCIKIESVNIGVRGGKKNIILATESGENYALKYFDKILQERESEKLKRMHTTLEHGYFVKYCVDTLNDFGFVVQDDYTENRFETSLIGSGGLPLICEPDFNITYDNRRYLFEAETGKCQKENIYQKLDKVYDLYDSDLIASTLFYICPNKKAVEKVEEAIEDWRRNNTIYYEFNVVVINASVRDNVGASIKNSMKIEASIARASI